MQTTNTTGWYRCLNCGRIMRLPSRDENGSRRCERCASLAIRSAKPQEVSAAMAQPTAESRAFEDAFQLAQARTNAIGAQENTYFLAYETMVALAENCKDSLHIINESVQTQRWGAGDLFQRIAALKTLAAALQPIADGAFGKM